VTTRQCPYCGKLVYASLAECPYCHETIPEIRTVAPRRSDVGRPKIRQGLLAKLLTLKDINGGTKNKRRNIYFRERAFSAVIWVRLVMFAPTGSYPPDQTALQTRQPAALLRSELFIELAATVHPGCTDRDCCLLS